MKFSDMLGDPDAPRETPAEAEPEPISVFAPAPNTPPPATDSWVDEPVAHDPVAPSNPSLPGPAVPAPPLEFAPAEPVAPRSGLAEVNVLSPSATPTDEGEAAGEIPGLAGLTVVDDDLLPSSRRARK